MKPPPGKRKRVPGCSSYGSGAHHKQGVPGRIRRQSEIRPTWRGAETMSNIKKLAEFINERDPDGELFPLFIAVLTMAAPAIIAARQEANQKQT